MYVILSKYAFSKIRWKNVFEDKSVKRNVLRVWWTGKYIKWILPQNRFLNWTEIDLSYLKEEVGEEGGACGAIDDWQEYI